MLTWMTMVMTRIGINEKSLKTNIMRKKLLYGLALTLVAFTSACSHDSENGRSEMPSKEFTYQLQLKADINGFDNGTTRAVYSWPDNAELYLQFMVGSERIAGKASYDSSTMQWTVTTNKKINADTDGDCEAFYIVNASGTSSQAVILNERSIIYQDTDGSFTFTEDEVMSVKLMLYPRTGRVRFQGIASTKFGVSGLTYHSKYDITSNTFSTTSSKLSSSFDNDGDTDYFYAMFSDNEKRQLTVDGMGKGVYLRSFGERVLSAGESGYITLPSSDNIPAGWTLVNTDNMQEITLPTVSSVEISKLRSHFATATATVTTLGNGTLSEVGFIYSTDSNPSLDNGTKIAVGRNATIESRLASLKAQTTYYIKAYAINERGISYGSIVHFTTLSEEEDGTGFGREDYGEDEDLNGESSSEGTITQEGYGDDVDLNNSSSSSGTIGKDDYGNDEDLNNTSSSSGTISKDGYGNDEDLNNTSSSSGTISKNNFDNDENWNQLKNITIKNKEL